MESHYDSVILFLDLNLNYPPMLPSNKSDCDSSVFHCTSSIANYTNLNNLHKIVSVTSAVLGSVNGSILAIQADGWVAWKADALGLN